MLLILSDDPDFANFILSSVIRGPYSEIDGGKTMLRQCFTQRKSAQLSRKQVAEFNFSEAVMRLNMRGYQVNNLVLVRLSCD